MDKTNLILNSTIELVDVQEEGNGKGRPFISRFIEPGIAHYKELGDILITKETLNKFINTMVGCPVIIEHEDVTDANADKLRVGVVSRVWFSEMDGYFYCEGILTDPEAIDLVKNQGYSVSCAYSFVSDNTKRTHNGKEIDMEFIDGEFLHLALVKDPRYEGANIVVNKNDDDLEWITVKGNHIPVKKGQSKDEAAKKFLDSKKEGNKEKSSDGREEGNNFKEINDEEVNKWGEELKLSQEQKNSLYDYSTDLYNKINPLLDRDMKEDDRFRPDFNQKLKNIIKTVDDSMSEIPKDISLTHLAYENDLKKFLGVENLDENIIGKTFTKKPYTSTAYSKESKYYKNMKDEKGRIELNIKTKKGTKAVPIEPFSFNKGEKEILLARNSTFKITNFKEENGKKYIDCEVIQTKANNSIGEVTMQVLNELKDFIKSVVSNEKEEEMKEVKNEDKRKLIDEVGGILKDKVDEELWRTVVGKLEKIAYEPSEDDKADNKAKNEEDEEKEAKNKCKNEEDEESKEDVTKNEDKPEDDGEDKEEDKPEGKAENKKVKNSMKDMVMGGSSNVQEQKLYVSRKERLEEGNKY